MQTVPIRTNVLGGREVLFRLLKKNQWKICPTNKTITRFCLQKHNTNTNRRRTSKRKSMKFNRFCIKSVKETGTKQECYYSSYVINLKWTNYVSVCTSVKSYMRVHAYLWRKVLIFISKTQHINDLIWQEGIKTTNKANKANSSQEYFRSYRVSYWQVSMTISISAARTATNKRVPESG